MSRASKAATPCPAQRLDVVQHQRPGQPHPRSPHRDTDHDDEVRSNLSYGGVATDRSFTNVALVVQSAPPRPSNERDEMTAAASMEQGYPSPRSVAGAAAAIQAPAQTDPLVLTGLATEASAASEHYLTVEDLEAMSPTSRGKADVNAAAVASGFDFRYVPSEAAGTDNATTPGTAHRQVNTRSVNGVEQHAGPPEVETESEAEDADSDARSQRRAYLSRFSFGESRRTPAGSGAAAVDDLLYTLGEVTYHVLEYFFPHGYDGPATPARGERDNNDSSTDSEPREDKKERDSRDPAFPPPMEDATRNMYAFPFLNSRDAQNKSTMPAAGLVSASEDATSDASQLHLLFLLSRLAFPVALTQVLRTSMGIITTAFMGNYLSTTQFAAASTGLAFTNLTALNIGNGFSAALDTLATQEHGRRKHSPKIVAILFRGVLCTFAVYIPIAVFYFFCEPVLAALIHEDLVADTAYFLRMSVFVATPMILNNNFIKFAQAQKVTQLGVISSTVGLVLLVPLLYLFRDGGIPGIIAALSINRMCVLASVVFSMFRNEGLRRCWRGYTVQEHIKSIFGEPQEFVHFVKVGLPILGANCADSWGFEALGIVAANIGATAAAAWSVVMAIYSLLFALHIGVAVAAAIRVGNAIGAGKGLLARKYVLSTVIFALSCTGFCVVAMWTLGRTMFEIMQNNDEVSERGGEISFLAGCTFLVDSLFYVLQGPFRGVGYNGVLLFIVAAAMWGVAVPLAILLGVMEGKDVEGILVSLMLGMMLGVPLQLAFLAWGVPWKKYDRAACEREREEESGEHGAV